jgi:hypothetical protein
MKKPEDEADRIRRYWLDPEERKKDEFIARFRNMPLTTRKKDPPTRADVLARYKERHGDNLGPEHVGMLCALTVDTADGWGLPAFTKTRDQRKTRARLLQYMSRPDPSGLTAPPDEDWRDFPELYEQFKQQQGIK